MSNYGQSNNSQEWGKWIIYRSGTVFGFGQAWVGSLLGCILWLISWCLLPGCFVGMLYLEILGQLLIDLGCTVKGMHIANVVVIVLGTVLGFMCWARVAVICMPDVFDRYKIDARNPFGGQ